MDELRSIARDYMEDTQLNPAFMDFVLAVFSSLSEGEHMDNGLVSYQSFQSFMSISGFSKINHRALFEQLDQNGDYKLDLSDVATFCLLCYGGKPVCEGCSSFIQEDRYFTCLPCFLDREQERFHLCTDCHENVRFHIDHDHHDDYVDNFTLLKLERCQKRARRDYIPISEEAAASASSGRGISPTMAAAAPANPRISIWPHLGQGLMSMARYGLSIATLIIGITGLI
ncbi:hypothetical protein SAY86_011576 [Trapa natans]|uniref:EF-hand domain-containing protein n=1 Tax=Trapa natans TaxID=22666 RepID=A0AAN7R6K0_TRANT|nr:hypothetical protein SAY86_011576 [Trapa natans]